MHETQRHADPRKRKRPSEVLTTRRLDDVTMGECDVSKDGTALQQVALAVEEGDAYCERDG